MRDMILKDIFNNQWKEWRGIIFCLLIKLFCVNMLHKIERKIELDHRISLKNLDLSIKIFAVVTII